MMAGDATTGVTIMRVTEGLDSGPAALAEEIAISPKDDYESLSVKLAELGGELLVRALDDLEHGRLQFTDQDEDQATYAEKVSPDERHLAPHRPATELERIVRALTPHVGAYLEIEGGQRLGVRAARAVQDGPAAGAIETRGDRLVLGASDGGLALEVVQLPGKKPMNAADFLRGHAPPEKAV
jgi:methionyl-tRNA formyltransferase